MHACASLAVSSELAPLCLSRSAPVTIPQAVTLMRLSVRGAPSEEVGRDLR